jgi:hypothetical protein
MQTQSASVVNGPTLKRMAPSSGAVNPFDGYFISSFKR